MLLLGLSFFVCLCGVGAVPVDNGVVGDPEISCGPTSVMINFDVQNNFEGQVYVKGLFDQDECRTEDRGRQVTGIELPFNTCNTRRTRSLNPKGVFVSSIVMISFHPLFITKVDRVYRIQCFYMEADKTVDTRLEVSMLTTDFQTQLVPMPVCRYDLLDGGPTGSIIEFAIVGQAIFHKWTCDTETIDTFCMIVRDCFVDDTNGDTVDLIGPDGCATDRYLINNPEYITDLMAGVEAHVFKYADRADLYFQCQITILVKEPNSACPRPACPLPPGRGAGAANPQLGPVQSNPEHPYPLQPGSPYLPGGSNVFGPLPPPRNDFRGAFIPPARGKREAPAMELGSLDVAAQMSSLDIPNLDEERKDENLSRLLQHHFASSNGDMCVSPGTFAAFALVSAFAFAAVVGSAAFFRFRK